MKNVGREIFIREFIRTVIKQIPPKREWIESAYLINLPRRVNLIESNKLSLIKPIKIIPRNDKTRTKLIHSIQVHKPQPQIKKSFPRKPAVLSTPAQTERENSPLLPISGSKIISILNDPAVVGIECPGADKNILVNKSGRIQPTQIKLSTTEIKNILDEISAETKIPLIGGIFKAVYKSVIITAVISEFVGSRFIIEKRPKQIETPIKS